MRSLRAKEAALRARVREIEAGIANLVEVLRSGGLSSVGSIRSALEAAERDKLAVESELHDVRQQMATVGRDDVDPGRVNRVLGDYRLLYDLATPAERGELIRHLFKRIEFRGPDEDVVVELYDQESPEPRGSRLRTFWLRMGSELRTTLRPANGERRRVGRRVE